MKGMILAALTAGILATSLACVRDSNANDDNPGEGTTTTEELEVEVEKTDEEWREILTDEEYYILRESGTERAFTGRYYDHKEDGMYVCAACGQELFASDDKFDSGTGWPSYTKPVENENVAEVVDRSHGMVRREIVCARCGGHLGHVFPDGPAPTGQRYCINSAALDFQSGDDGDAAED